MDDSVDFRLDLWIASMELVAQGLDPTSFEILKLERIDPLTGDVVGGIYYE